MKQVSNEVNLTESYRTLKIKFNKQISVIDNLELMDFDCLKKTIKKMKNIQKKIRRIKYEELISKP